ncbi:bifunctional hydroxymethylpyrimidine kinase/phosphomethylpyrimidine kinase [Amycolatopsis endophytica]|uniref:Hydroxymethylpyrimidine kinase/phosphomethylpyrimidine kinase n=1 Tax=Amycolatopsis endophytica TaxID=860233 RepID=A0A853B706_9PSEU|nr:bifunctional hydroxymethylpyrimidine kinase/phosphomethylpyrimidine kinase [Amycolatopsis endophytica]NYI90770.1 hydroxymethylpyrimidine kinase/phosphomethylpyrimidine kinase [Amycolatopsis endophytica]
MGAVPRVLSVAGTDPTGGAGIQADLKSIAAAGGYGMAVVTALVAQNTTGVRAIHRPDTGFLAGQLNAVSDDVTLDAVKIGMLFDAGIARTVRDWLAATRPPHVVLDPVLVATSGDRLSGDGLESALAEVIPLTDLVTPNVAELGILLGEPAAVSWPELIGQATRLAARHGVRVLAKGGHLASDDARDALAGPGGEVRIFSAPRVDTVHTHGTGCSLSASLATHRARTDSWEAAIPRAKQWLSASLAAGADLDVGTGRGPVSPLAVLWDRGGVHAPDPATVRTTWWNGIADLRARIHDTAFVTGLGQGTLDPRAFAWFLAQDLVYLREFARVLSRTAALAPTPEEQVFWAGCSRDALVGETEVHTRWIEPRHRFTAAPAPATTRYTDHLLAVTTRGDYATAVAAVLPCLWIYHDVGHRLGLSTVAGNPFADWIRSYQDPGVERMTEQAIDIATTHAASASDARRTAMQAVFRTSAEHELAFFRAPTQASAA